MSHFISKIASKIFLFFLATVLGLSAYFIATSYYNVVNEAEESEMRRIRSVAHTFSLGVEWPLERAADTLIAAPNMRQVFRKQIVNMIGEVNAANHLDPGVHMVLHYTDDDTWEVLSESGHSSELPRASVIDKLNALKGKVDADIEHTRTGNKRDLFYATTLSLPSFEDLEGFIYVRGDLESTLHEARLLIFKRAGLFAIAMLIIVFVGHRALRKMFAHESANRERLIDYARLADERNSELETLSFVLQRSDNLIVLTDDQGRIEWLNKGDGRKNNYTREELDEFIGRELAEVSQYAKISETIDHVLSTKTKYMYEAKSYDEDRNEFWASTTVTPILDEDGEVSKLLFIDSDITKLKAAEEEITKLARFPMEFSRPVMRFGFDGFALYANDAGSDLLRRWGADLNEKIRHKKISHHLSEVATSGKKKDVNIEFGNRIYKLHLHPVTEEEYINVFAEDITEDQTTEREYRARALQLEQHNLNITDSINYARRIQSAIIPGEDEVRKFFKDSFVMNRPKDIVSGDFIWLHEVEPKREYLVALADCTGHGVPGAMMSIVGHSLLNEIVENEGITDPATILQRLNAEIIRSLRQKTNADTSDGMDVSITKINLEERKVVYAGAYQPLYWVNGKLNVFKGDRQPIGGIHHNTDRQFTNHEFQISKGDSLYFASDGFVDQFGGPQDKKFLSKRLMQLLVENHKYSMQAQSNIFKKTFEDWKQDRDQVDDVSLLGIKF